MAAELLKRAGLALDAHKLDEAETLAAQALRLNPHDGNAVHMMANVYLQRKQLAKAEELIRQSIGMDDKTSVFYLTYGVILQEQGRIDEAIAMNEKALAFSPPVLIPYIYTNMGSCLYDKRQVAASIECYGKALAANPDFAPAYFRRGIAWCSLKGAHSAEMEADFDRAIALDPGNAVMFQKMTAAYHEKMDFLQAIKVLRHAIGLRPDLEDAWVLLAYSYYRIGNADTALSIYEHLKEKYPANPTVRLQLAYVLPAIPMSNEDIIKWRKRFMESLDLLIEEKFTVRDPEWRMLNLPFYQGYHGQNNLPLMKKMAEFFLKACPGIDFVAPHCMKAGAKKDKMRLGFICEMFHSDLLSQFYGPLLDALAKDGRFEIVLMANSGRRNEQVESLSARYITLPTYLSPAREAVAREQLDMLIYLDIGMNVMNYLLAFARLAPIQMVMGGHPITTGIPNMDYFISSKAVEPENASEHYSEKLLLLEKNTVVFRRKKMPAGAKTREELGLPADARLYACPVMPFKLHPDMDKVFASVLERDGQAVIILFDSPYKTLWRASLQKRFLASMSPELAARIHFLPYALGDHFYHLMRAMDCVMDTFHFSFGTTAFLMLAADVPFITLPGEFQRGRAGYMLYRQMDMPELVAESPQQYVELALKLAQDKVFHKHMEKVIRERSDRIFEDYSVVGPFIAALWDVYQSDGA